MAARKRKRSGVHVEGATPSLYRQFVAAATPYVAKRASDGSFTILDEYRWHVMLSAYEAREVVIVEAP